MSTMNFPIPDRDSLSVIFSNLAKASEKQDRDDRAVLFQKLSDSMRSETETAADWNILKEEIEAATEEDFRAVQSRAEAVNDRGAQRAVRWGEKVCTLQKSLADRYIKKGDELLEGKSLFICEACGFIYLGSESPALCPVCKAPASRISRI